MTAGSITITYIVITHAYAVEFFYCSIYPTLTLSSIIKLYIHSSYLYKTMKQYSQTYIHKKPKNYTVSKISVM